MDEIFKGAHLIVEPVLRLASMDGIILIPLSGLRELAFFLGEADESQPLDLVMQTDSGRIVTSTLEAREIAPCREYIRSYLLRMAEGYLP